jgi:hypothetical protein
MSTKYATDTDSTAGRNDRPTPTNRVSTPYEVVKAHGVESPDFTKSQTIRSHELATDKAAIAAGAHKPGKIEADRSACYEKGEDSAARRAAHVLAKRRETEAIFDSHRKYSAKFPYAKNPKFKKA